MKRVLVLLAAYNGSRWIEEQVRSILSQEGVVVNLLISDDASKDKTVPVIQANWGKDPRVHLVVNEIGSGSSSGNFFNLFKLANLAEFDFVALSDQDDIWSVDKLATAVTALSSSGAAGYSAAVSAEWPDGKQICLKQNPTFQVADFIFEGAGQGCTFVLTVAFFSRVQQFMSTASVKHKKEKMHFHDWFLYILVRSWKYTWYFDQNPSMLYRQHESNEIGARGGPGAVARRLALLRTGWYSDQIKKACDVYQDAGGADPELLYRIEQLNLRISRSLLDGISLAFWLVRRSRRKLGDRIILAIGALLRWI